MKEKAKNKSYLEEIFFLCHTNRKRIGDYRKSQQKKGDYFV